MDPGTVYELVPGRIITVMGVIGIIETSPVAYGKENQDLDELFRCSTGKGSEQ